MRYRCGGEYHCRGELCCGPAASQYRRLRQLPHWYESFMYIHVTCIYIYIYMCVVCLCAYVCDGYTCNLYIYVVCLCASVCEDTRSFDPLALPFHSSFSTSDTRLPMIQKFKSHRRRLHLAVRRHQLSCVGVGGWVWPYGIRQCRRCRTRKALISL